MQTIQALIQNAIDTAVANKEVAGATVLVIKNGKETYYAEGGFADLENQKKIERNTIHHLYSMSKPITAAAAMLLVQDGIIDLCESVGDYIPSFKHQKYVENGKIRDVPEDKPVRILDLMNMTSGLVYPGLCSEAEMEVGRLFVKMEKGIKSGKMLSTREFAEKAGECPLNFIPGSHFQYGTSADVLGAVIEVVTGKSFGTFLSERIFDPLEMADTGFFVPDEKKDRMAKIYAFHKGDLVLSHTNHLGIRNDGDVNLFESGGAGLFSTLDDYAHFTAMLMNDGMFNGKQILKSSAVKFLTTGKLLPFQQEDFWNWRGLEGYTYGNLMRVLEEPGQAVMLGNKGEYGWDGWLGTYFVNDPSTKTTFLMMTQKTDYGTGHLTRKLRNIIF